MAKSTCIMNVGVVCAVGGGGMGGGGAVEGRRGAPHVN